jgi:hypothetical protein
MIHAKAQSEDAKAQRRITLAFAYFANFATLRETDLLNLVNLR